MEVKVEYEYEACQDDELSLKVGDIIKNVVIVEDGWMEGELNGRKGVFPENFVQKVETSEKEKVLKDKEGLSKREAPQRKSVRELASDFKGKVPMGFGGPIKKKVVVPTEKKRCKVLYEYKPVNEDELELQVGDVVDFIKEVEDGWYEGHLGEKTGVFPSNFVELITVNVHAAEEHNEEAAEEPNAVESSESETKSTVKPKKVMGIGLGNIFEGGPIRLRSVNKRPVPPPPEKDKPPEIKESTRPSAVSNNNDIVKRERGSTGERAIVRYSYVADQPDELNLKEGDVVNIIERHLEDDGWWKGEVNGKVGVFPDNFVELIPTEELKPKKPPPPAHYPKVPEKSAVPSDTHDVKKPPTKNNYKKDGFGVNKPPPPTIGKKPSSLQTKSSTEPPKLPESAKPDTKSILSSSNNKESKSKVNSTLPHIDENNHNSDVQFEDLEPPKSEKLVHLTANRAKGPKKRPPSNIFTPMDGEDIESEETASSAADSAPVIKYNSNTDRLSQAVGTKLPAHDYPDKPKVADHHEKPKITDYHEKPRITDYHDRPKIADYHEKPKVNDFHEKPKVNTVPPRPPAPDQSTHPAVSSLQKMVEDLQREVRELKANTVSKSTFNELKSELDSMKSIHTKKLRELTNEVDEEKKLRLNTQVEIERIKKLLVETNV